MNVISFFKCIFLTGLMLWVPHSICAMPLAAPVSAITDSLNCAQNNVLKGDSSVEAFRLAVRQFDLIKEQPDALHLTANAFQTLGTISRLGGDIGSSAIFTEAGLSLANSIHAGNSLERVSFLLAHALTVRLSNQTGALDLARSLIDECMLVADTLAESDPVLFADILQAQANFSRASKNMPLAIDQYQASLEARLRISNSHRLDVVDNEVWLASAIMMFGDISTAKILMQHCREDLIQLNLAEHHLMPAALNCLASIAIAEQNQDVAIDYYQQSYSTILKAQQSLFPGFSKRRLNSPLLNNLAHLNHISGKRNSAWQSFATGHQNSGNQAFALARARKINPDFVTRVQDATTQSTHMLDEVVSALLDLGGTESDSTTITLASDILIRYAEQLATTLTLKDQLRNTYGKKQDPIPSVVEIQASLLPSQVFVGYFNTIARGNDDVTSWRNVTYAVVIRKDEQPEWVQIDKTQTHDSNPGQSALMTFQKLMHKASEWPTRLPADPLVTDLLHTLYKIYFEPIQPFITGKTEVILLSTEVPAGLVFPALINNNGKPLVDLYAFRHVIGVEDVVKDAATISESTMPSLVLGDPAYDTSSHDLKHDDPTLDQAMSSYMNTVLSRSMVAGVLDEGSFGLKRLPRIQSSGWEARGIASMTSPVMMMTGKEATEQGLNQALRGARPKRFRWIHLATHALMHSRIPERSALALSPLEGEGLLYVEEIGFGWSLDCNLIALSGCQTGRGPQSWYGGPLGFVQALHAAGAKNLLLSSEKVDDIATALLMERFYANISNRPSPRVEPAKGAPLSYSFALAEAQQWLKNLETTERERPFAHPVYWSTFHLIGRGGFESN